jgi:hypothetical protein
MNRMGENGWRERAENIDRRLDRLTERHEALTQSVELMHRDWEERWRQTQELVDRVVGPVDKLVQVAQMHERRLDNLEGRG